MLECLAKKHFDKFQEVITSDNKPYGLHRSREEKFFTGEKILSLRKCERPIFTYTDYDCYVLAEYYVIKTNVVDLKYLIALLNSKLIEFWLFYKGKRQGNIYQIDKEPLINIPIKKATVQEQKLFINLVNEIFTIAKSEDYSEDSLKKTKVKKYENQIDQLIYKLYYLNDDEIEIVENFHKKA
jgi:adenine-specific DNA-methyltransferase